MKSKKTKKKQRKEEEEKENKEERRGRNECRERRYILQSETNIYWSAVPARPSGTIRLTANWSVGQ